MVRDLENGSSQERVLGQVVDSLADASDAIRENDVTDIVRKAGNFAKQNPAVFVGAAVLAGFAATRLIGAAIADGNPDQDDLRQSDDDIS